MKKHSGERQSEGNRLDNKQASVGLLSVDRGESTVQWSVACSRYVILKRLSNVEMSGTANKTERRQIEEVHEGGEYRQDQRTGRKKHGREYYKRLTGAILSPKTVCDEDLDLLSREMTELVKQGYSYVWRIMSRYEEDVLEEYMKKAGAMARAGENRKLLKCLAVVLRQWGIDCEEDIELLDESEEV